MPTRNVNLTNELESFVLARVESGRYENASEVVRAALRTLEREERQYEAKLAALQTAIDAGDISGIAEGSSFDRVRQALKLPAMPHRRKSVARRDPQGPQVRKSVVPRAPIEKR
jgi:antitoxin ParD1/3/4